MNWITGGLIAVAVLGFAAAAPAAAQTPAPAAPTVAIRGFVSSTFFLQDQAFGLGNGQNALWAASGEASEDEWFLGGDVRNTRLQVAITGPQVYGNWKTSGVVELDFFAGFANEGALGDEQPTPRMRLAYADLNNGRTTLRVGQQFSLLAGNVPASLSHIAFPLGFGSAGFIGWRFPGLAILHRLTPSASPTNLQLQLGAYRGSWAGPGANTDNLSAGEAAAIPQLEARLDLSSRTAGGMSWGMYAVGHWDRKDLSGVGVDEPAAGQDNDLDGTAVEFGLRAMPGPLTFQGNAYWGRAIGQQVGNLLQFGDIAGWGAWGQVGLALSPRISVWGFAGTDDPDDDDVLGAVSGAARLQNQTLSGMLRYSEGPYGAALEWMQASTDWAGAASEGTRPEFDRTANQLSLSVFYAF